MSVPLKIFVSHSSAYVDLAESLKRCLCTLDPARQLDIRISPEMTGASDWRLWIEEQVCNADVFLLVYPHSAMEMNWCNYELGRFYDKERRRHIVCLKNVDIPKPPPPFEPYQAYDSDESGLFKFLKELFADGVFSEGAPLNADVGSVTTEWHERAREVARRLADGFAQARVHDHLYIRRIQILPKYVGARLDLDNTMISGNVEGLRLLGLDADASLSWSQLAATLPAGHDWLNQIEKNFDKISLGALPPSLPLCHIDHTIYVPVITRARHADAQLRELALIFVMISSEDMRRVADWVTPAAMPESFAGLVRLLRIILRMRWGVLEPRLTEVRYGKLAQEGCAEAARAIVADYDRVQREVQAEAPMGLAQFFSLFDRSLRPELQACGQELTEALQGLDAVTGGDGAQIAQAIDRLLSNNLRWLQMAVRQFELNVEDLAAVPMSPALSH